jgi:hypothetical protein
VRKDQEKVKELLTLRSEKLRPWIRGKIPKHYKRISLEEDKALHYATIGAKQAFAYFDAKLFYTQSIIVGAALSGDFKKMSIITNSQYGKSYIMSMIALVLASVKGHPVYPCGADTGVSEIIMNNVIKNLNLAHPDIKDRVLVSSDKIEKLQTAVSKSKLAFKGGGIIQSLSLGETYSDALNGNSAVGRGGHYIIDEAARISDDAYAEMGRSEFAALDEESAYMRIDISNPHNAGRFYDDMIRDEIADNELVIWMDCLTALEEERISSVDQIMKSEFFKNKSTCTRYLLCELDDYSEDSMFGELEIDDSPVKVGSLFYMGIDPCYKGKDNIELMVLENFDGMPRLVSYEVIEKANWEDGKTGLEISGKIANIINKLKCPYVCIDIGYGIWLLENLVPMCPYSVIQGVNFGSSPTKNRIKMRNYAAVYAENKRSELHLDLQNLIEEKAITATTEIKEALSDQLRAIKCIHKQNNGKISVISKKDVRRILGRSPDTLDCCLLAIHAAIIDAMKGNSRVYSEGREVVNG